MIDVAAARSDTPGAEFVAHFNNAGASLMPTPVVDVVTGYLREEARLGAYETAERHADDHDAVYGALGRLIGAHPSEVALTDSATRAWGLAFAAMQFDEGDRILTTTSEYASNVIAFLQVAERSRAVVDVVPDTPAGEIDVGALDEMVDERVRLIAINHIPTNGGLVNPAAEVGRVASRHGIPYLLDACQSVGQLPLDVEAIGCDLLSAASRKFLRGPRGAGFLYVRDSILDRLAPAVADLRGARWLASDCYELRADARRFELWEQSPALMLGMGRAAHYALGVGVEAIWERLVMLADCLRGALTEVSGVTVRDLGAVKGAIVTFTVDDHDAGSVKARLAEQGINVSIATPFSARFDMEARGLPDLVRASVHYFNTEYEIDRLVGAVSRL